MKILAHLGLLALLLADLTHASEKIALNSCESSLLAGNEIALPQPKQTLFLDADAVLINPEQNDRPRSELHPEDYIEADGHRYRSASFLPEFLYALKHLIRFPGTDGIDIAIYSGGPRKRNNELIEGVQKSFGRSTHGIIDRSFGFEDLQRVRDLPAAFGENPPQNGELAKKIRTLRTQDEWDFFATFKKTLRNVMQTWGGHRSLNHTLILDDNVDVTPADEFSTLIAIARSDYNDEDHLHPYYAHAFPLTSLGKLQKPNKHPAQIARSRYRLVRALGVLEILTEQVALGHYNDLPEAALQFQWDEQGRLKTQAINDPLIYQRGMAIVRRAYEEMKSLGELTYERADKEFIIEALIARPVDSTITDAAYPWDPVPSRRKTQPSL